MLCLQAYEQPQQNYKWYWMLPRHQLLVLAGWGRAMRVGFLDINEYLVVPGAKAAVAAATDASTNATQGLQATCLKFVQSQHQLQEQLLQEAAAFLQADGPPLPVKYQVYESNDVLRVPRFDTLLQTPCSAGGGLPMDTLSSKCQPARNLWYKVVGQQLEISRCPVQQGGPRGSRKPVVSPHNVVVVRHYTAAAKGTTLNGPTVPTACAYLLHIVNLMASNQGQLQHFLKAR